MNTALFQEPINSPTTSGDPDNPEASPSQYADELPPPDAVAPYGYTRDPDGAIRPKKTAGRRPRTSAPKAPAGLPPSLEELKEAKATTAAKPSKPTEDVPPASVNAKRPKLSLGKPKGPKPKPEPEPLPPFRAGPIAKGVNRLYRKAGRIVKMWDVPLGSAIIACTMKDEDDEEAATVGEAWEELAKVNPRIRAILLKLITGSAYGALFWAHAPIFLALLMKDGVRDRLPGAAMLGALLGDDDDTEAGPGGGMPDLGGLGINQIDVSQLMAMAQGVAAQMAAGMPRSDINDVRPATAENEAA